jgi:hypothetical protein
MAKRTADEMEKNADDNGKEWQMKMEKMQMTTEKNGSSGRIRTYNPSVNSRMLYH